MKKFFFALLASIVFIRCGQKKTASEPSSNVLLDYDSITDKLISWNELLIQEKEKYRVYVYSVTCGHCNDIKQQILSYSLDKDDLYFIEYNQSIPICNSDVTLMETNNLDDVCIFGTPSLLTVEKGFLTENIAGSTRILESI